MPWGQSHVRSAGVHLSALAIGTVVWSGTSRAAEPKCALSVTVEGVPRGTALADRLTALARREGACSSQTWALRVAPGPKGAYVVALWNGTELETRFASQAEVEPVASVLLRVALERQGRDPASAAASAHTESAAPSSSAPAPPALEPATRTVAPAAPAAAAFSLGLEAGPTVSNAGFGAEAGLIGFVHGRHLGAGVFGRYGVQGRPAQSRGAFEAGGLGAIGTPLGSRAWLGGLVELGVSLQRAKGEADGNSANIAASGAMVGGGVIALFTPTPRLLLGARVMGRWSSPSADARDVTSTTAKNPGNGNGRGNGANKTVTTTTTDAASQNAVDALGGGAVVLALSVGYAF